MILFSFVFFFTDPATTEIYTLSLHDALPISAGDGAAGTPPRRPPDAYRRVVEGICGREWGGHSRRRRLPPALLRAVGAALRRSEEHTSELQSLAYLVCRLLLEKKKKTHDHHR